MLDLKSEQRQASADVLAELGAFVAWRRLRAGLPDLQAEIDAALVRLGEIETARGDLEAKLSETANGRAIVQAQQDRATRAGEDAAAAAAEVARLDRAYSRIDSALQAARKGEIAARQEHRRLCERLAAIEAMPRPPTGALDLVL